MKIFRANLGKFGQNILWTPKKLSVSTPTVSRLGNFLG